jgi:hypothetical protein
VRLEMKGQLFTLESLIAVLMLFLIVVYLFQNPPATPEFKRINYKLMAYDSLKMLEKTGELRNDAIKKNVTSIKNKMSPFLPGFLNYTVTIFNETANVTEIPSLSNEKNTLSVSYFLAGDIDNFKPMEVRVYIWGFE